MNENGQTLGAHPEIPAHDLQRNEWDSIFGAPAVQTLFCFD
jgi:hypothetical protein